MLTGVRTAAGTVKNKNTQSAKPVSGEKSCQEKKKFKKSLRKLIEAKLNKKAKRVNSLQILHKLANDTQERGSEQMLAIAQKSLQPAKSASAIPRESG